MLLTSNGLFRVFERYPPADVICPLKLLQRAEDQRPTFIQRVNR